MLMTVGRLILQQYRAVIIIGPSKTQKLHQNGAKETDGNTPAKKQAHTKNNTIQACHVATITGLLKTPTRQNDIAVECMVYKIQTIWITSKRKKENLLERTIRSSTKKFGKKLVKPSWAARGLGKLVSTAKRTLLIQFIRNFTDINARIKYKI